MPESDCNLCRLRDECIHFEPDIDIGFCPQFQLMEKVIAERCREIREEGFTVVKNGVPIPHDPWGPVPEGDLG
jgi:hypothetical protein